MEGIEVQKTEDKFIVSVDRNLIDEEALMKVLEGIYIEYLAQKAGFDERIIELGEEIKRDWWQKNKERFLRKIESYETSNSGQ